MVVGKRKTKKGGGVNCSNFSERTHTTNPLLFFLPPLSLPIFSHAPSPPHHLLHSTHLNIPPPPFLQRETVLLCVFYSGEKGVGGGRGVDFYRLSGGHDFPFRIREIATTRGRKGEKRIMVKCNIRQLGNNKKLEVI